MEVYYKNLISKENSLDGLVDDIMRVVQGVDDLSQAEDRMTSRNGAARRMTGAVKDLMQGARTLAESSRELMRKHPWCAAGVALGLGMVLGNLISCAKSRRSSSE